MVTIKDVAKEAGLSITTVSRVMNKKGYLSKEAIDKVNEAIEKLDYHPNFRAKAFSAKRTHILGVIVPDVSHPFFGEMAAHIEQYAYNHGYSIMVCNSYNDDDKEQVFLDMLAQKRMDGLITASHSLDISRYDKRHDPIIAFERYLNEAIPYVSCDNYNGGYIAGKHLIEQGCRSLLYISGPDQSDILTEQRLQGFIASCRRNSVNYKSVSKKDIMMSVPSGYKFIKEELSDTLHEYDGVFCSGDYMAHTLYIYCKDNGIHVPNDLKIIGFDNDRLTQIVLEPRLTTISQPIKDISEALVMNLIKIIEGKEKVINLQLGVNLVKGKTT